MRVGNLGLNRAVMIVDVIFRIRGTTIPTDHGFALYSAITKFVAEVHGAREVGIHPIVGQLLPDRRLAIDKRSRLVIRTDHEGVGRFLSLAGQALRVGDSLLTVGVPTTRALRPAPTLGSRLVVIKGFTKPEPFLEAVHRQLRTFGISAEPTLVVPVGVRRFEGRSSASFGPVRRTLRIHDREIVGYAVRVDGLDAESSVSLQEQGLGGRRRFGCGILTPVRVGWQA